MLFKNRSIKKQDSWQMFDQISQSYNIVNDILSLRIHHYWKSKLVKLLPKHSNLSILDIATGTGDILFKIMKKRHPCISSIKGMDLSIHMMDVGKKKLLSKPYKHKADFIKGDACSIPFNDQSFDVITISFGIRNVPDLRKSLVEMYRCLNPQGTLLILEFSIPQNRIFKPLYLFYFRHILPFIGGIFSGKFMAYRYLNNTVEDFPYGDAFSKIIKESGFKDVQVRPLSLGIATIYVAKK